MSDQVYSLDQFFGGYLHQDWSDDYGTWQNAVRHFMAEGTDSERSQTVAGIERLLLDILDDEELSRHLYRELGCYYSPRPDAGGPTVRQWLRDVAVLLRGA